MSAADTSQSDRTAPVLDWLATELSADADLELAALVRHLDELGRPEISRNQFHRCLDLLHVRSLAISGLFRERFVADAEPYRLAGYRLSRNGHDRIEARLGTPKGERILSGEGQGAIAAFADAWSRFAGRSIAVLDYREHAIGEGTDAEAAAYVLASIDGERVAGAAIDRDVVAASLKAVLAAVNRSAGAAGRSDTDAEGIPRRQAAAT